MHDRNILANNSAGTTKGKSLVNIAKAILIPGTLALGAVAGLGGGAILSAATANAATDTASTTASTDTTDTTGASASEATTAAVTTTDESDGTSDTETATAAEAAANDQSSTQPEGDCPSRSTTN